jgi:N-acyl-D-aspartate/D-glutamate deacylase
MLNFLLPYEVWSDGPLGVLGRLDRPEIRARFRAGLDALAVPLDQITIAWTACTSRPPGGTREGDVSVHSALSSEEPGQPAWGLKLADFVAQRGKPVEEALIDLLIDSNLATLMVVGPHGKDHLVEPLIGHDLAILGSDGIYFPGGHVHPRVFGSAGRWLGPLVRDRKVQSLETAIHKASGKSAARFGLTDRGVIRQGAFADLIVFDPVTISDRATYDQPLQSCVGVHTVIVNGRPIVADGDALTSPDGQLPGRRLRAVHSRE